MEGRRQLFQEPFKTSALADSFRSQLLTAARQGEASNTKSGLPVSMSRQEHTASWYEFACAYVDMKWPDAAGKSRMGIADTLATATPALLAASPSRADQLAMRRALYTWAMNTRVRGSGPPPADIARAIRWLEANTRPVGDLAEPEVLRAVMAALGKRQNGRPAAASTAQRKRAVFHNALEYAVERRLLASNPLAAVRVKNRKTVEEVDRRVVVNPDQAVRLLDAVGQDGEPGRRLVAFFGLMYYAALRPAEAANLPGSALQLPAEGWGELFVPGSAPTTGAAWSDNGRRRDERGLKHRAREAVRVVPSPPPLTVLLRAHLDEFGTTSAGRLFGAVRSDGDLSDRRLRPRVGSCPHSGTQRPGSRIAARAAAIRPAARRRLHVAERGRSADPGCRVGRAQRRGPATRLRQVPRRAGGRCAAARRCGSRRRSTGGVTDVTVTGHTAVTA
jgi:integrase